MKVNRTLDLNLFNLSSLGASALEIDNLSNMLYVQDGGSRRIFEIDINSFEVKRILKGAVYARKIIADSENNRLYVLDYLGAKLLLIELSTGKKLRAVKIGAKASDMQMYGSDIYINSASGIMKVDIEK